jgi:serine/threonine protein kinase
MLRPLFPGNSESDMIQRVCQIMGSPNNSIWPEGMKHAASRRVKFPNCNKMPLQKLIPHASADAIDVMDKMMLWHPSQRLTCRLVTQRFFYSNARNCVSTCSFTFTAWCAIDFPMMIRLCSESLKHGYFQLDPASSNAQAAHSSRADLNENSQSNRKSDEKKERRRGEKILVGPSAVSASMNFERPFPGNPGLPVSLSPQHSKASPPPQPKSISKMSRAVLTHTEDEV